MQGIRLQIMCLWRVQHTHTHVHIYTYALSAPETTLCPSTLCLGIAAVLYICIHRDGSRHAISFFTDSKYVYNRGLARPQVHVCRTQRILGLSAVKVVQATTYLNNPAVVKRYLPVMQMLFKSHGYWLLVALPWRYEILECFMLQPENTHREIDRERERDRQTDS